MQPKSTQEGSFLEKLTKRFDFGIFVGVRRVSNESIIATKEGIIFERCIKRISDNLRWGGR